MSLDSAQQLIEGGSVNKGMEQLARYLREMRLSLPAEDWKAFVASEVLTHPIRSLIHQDPFTHHSFSKPRGYPGDAALIDYIYGCAPPRYHAVIRCCNRKLCDEFTGM